MGAKATLGCQAKRNVLREHVSSSNTASTAPLLTSKIQPPLNPSTMRYTVVEEGILWYVIV